MSKDQKTKNLEWYENWQPINIEGFIQKWYNLL